MLLVKAGAAVDAFIEKLVSMLNLLYRIATNFILIRLKGDC